MPFHITFGGYLKFATEGSKLGRSVAKPDTRLLYDRAEGEARKPKVSAELPAFHGCVPRYENIIF